MASKITYKVDSLNQEIKILTGTFEIAASGGAATKIYGYNYSVAKTATGEYTITLDNNWAALMSASVLVQAVAAVDLTPQIKSAVVTDDTRTVVIFLKAGATPTEPSAVTRVHFTLHLSNSSLRKV